MTREDLDFIGAMNMCDEISNEAYKKIMCHCEEQEPCREQDDYENEIEDLHNRLDIAEYDKEKLREEVTRLEEKIKTLEQEPSGDAISRAELLMAIDTWDKFGFDHTGCFVREPKDDFITYVHYDDVIKCIKGMPSVNPQEPCGDAISRQVVLDLVEHYNSDGLGSVFYGYEEGVKFANAVNKLPSVNPQEPKTDVLGKIRTEIDNAELPKNRMSFFRDGINTALEIIDKYKEAQE